MAVTRHSFIPAVPCHFVRHDEHHEVICGCIQIKQEVVGVEPKIVSRRHSVTHIE